MWLKERGNVLGSKDCWLVMNSRVEMKGGLLLLLILLSLGTRCTRCVKHGASWSIRMESLVEHVSIPSDGTTCSRRRGCEAIHTSHIPHLHPSGGSRLGDLPDVLARLTTRPTLLHCIYSTPVEISPSSSEQRFSHIPRALFAFPGTSEWARLVDLSLGTQG